MKKQQIVAEIIKGQNGKAVTVTFIRRTDDKKTGAKAGDRRVLNGRLGVKSKLRGGELAYDPADYDLITIYDLQKHDYRSIPLDAVEEIKADGQVYSFKD